MIDEAARDAISGLLELIADVDAQDESAFPEPFVRKIAQTGALGAIVPAEYGGLGFTYADLGELNRLVAESSSSLQSLFTVHSMVCRALFRWANPGLDAELVRELANGTSTAAFALTEEQAGSDIRGIRTRARRVRDGWVLDGSKHWVTFGLTADVFLVFAKSDHGDVALVVRREDPGVSVRPAPQTSGFAAAQLAELDLAGCRVLDERLVSRPGTGLSHVASDALTIGRLCVAFGAYGLARAAQAAALERVTERKQFGRPLHQLQLVQGLLADAAVAADGAELLCRRAADALDQRDEWAISHVLTAKLAASRAASMTAGAAAQVHGATGLVRDSAVDRLVQDARVLEVIEGSTQLIQQLIASQLVIRHRATTGAGPTDRERNRDDY